MSDNREFLEEALLRFEEKIILDESLDEGFKDFLMSAGRLAGKGLVAGAKLTGKAALATTKGLAKGSLYVLRQGSETVDNSAKLAAKIAKAQQKKKKLPRRST